MWQDPALSLRTYPPSCPGPMTTRAVAPAPAPGALDRWRRDPPGCRDRIHLNNAGAALMPQPVLETLTRHLEREAAIGAYEAAEEAAGGVGETYELVGRLVGAAARNIALVENATVAFSQALSAFDFRGGDRIVTTRTDYPSNQLMYLSLARRWGVETVRARSEEHTSELQSRLHLVCRLLLEKKKKKTRNTNSGCTDAAARVA